jgi:hypothetical protein
MTRPGPRKVLDTDEFVPERLYGPPNQIHQMGWCLVHNPENKKMGSRPIPESFAPNTPVLNAIRYKKTPSTGLSRTRPLFEPPLP